MEDRVPFDMQRPESEIFHTLVVNQKAKIYFPSPHIS